MFINSNNFFYTIIKPIQQSFPIKHRIRIMYNTMMIRADNHLIIRIIIQAINKIINMMSFRYMRTIFFSYHLSAYLASVSI